MVGGTSKEVRLPLYLAYASVCDVQVIFHSVLNVSAIYRRDVIYTL
jgi:hypothetical protein